MQLTTKEETGMVEWAAPSRITCWLAAPLNQSVTPPKTWIAFRPSVWNLNAVIQTLNTWPFHDIDYCSLRVSELWMQMTETNSLGNYRKKGNTVGHGDTTQSGEKAGAESRNETRNQTPARTTGVPLSGTAGASEATKTFVLMNPQLYMTMTGWKKVPGLAWNMCLLLGWE